MIPHRHSFIHPLQWRALWDERKHKHSEHGSLSGCDPVQQAPPQWIHCTETNSGPLPFKHPFEWQNIEKDSSSNTQTNLGLRDSINGKSFFWFPFQQQSKLLLTYEREHFFCMDKRGNALTEMSFPYKLWLQVCVLWSSKGQRILAEMMQKDKRSEQAHKQDLYLNLWRPWNPGTPEPVIIYTLPSRKQVKPLLTVSNFFILKTGRNNICVMFTILTWNWDENILKSWWILVEYYIGQTTILI